jgi:hypothetical protein
MRQMLLRAVLLLASWAIGLLVAAWIVPGVSLSVPGFIVAVVVFAVTQAILSLSILKLPHRYASLLLGGTGLALTIVALILASVLTHGLTIDGMASWLATTVVVWLVTTIGAITLPECSSATGPARPDQIHAGTNGCTWVARVEILHFARVRAVT